MRTKLLALAAATAAALVLATPGLAAVGTSFPAGFPTILDASLGTPVLGFGGSGPVRRTPVIFLHGNNDTPFATACNPFYGSIHSLADSLLAHGYTTAELWGLGYQGDQCDLLGDQTLRSGVAHTTVASIPDLRRFVHAVRAYTHAKRVDIVGHSLGVTLARAWIRQDNASRFVRRLVAIDGPNHGIINCSPSPANYWQLPSLGGFTPDSPVCLELGAQNTPFLKWLNRGKEKPRGVQTLAIRNADTSFVYFPIQDGVLAPVPALDRTGKPTDFSRSAALKGAENVDVTGQGAYDPLLGTAHLGILNSPHVWGLTAEFLLRSKHGGDGGDDD